MAEQPKSTSSSHSPFAWVNLLEHSVFAIELQKLMRQFWQFADGLLKPVRQLWRLNDQLWKLKK